MLIIAVKHYIGTLMTIYGTVGTTSEGIVVVRLAIVP